MDEGEIEIDSVEPIEFPEITPELAREPGFSGVADPLGVARFAHCARTLRPNHTVITSTNPGFRGARTHACRIESARRRLVRLQTNCVSRQAAGLKAPLAFHSSGS
jgi:hypothetical protein